MSFPWVEPGRAIFTHKERDIRLLVHGDDFLVLADDEGHAFVDQVLKKRYEFKCDGHIGPGQEKQTMSVLNRLVKYHPGHWTGHIRSRSAPRRSADQGIASGKTLNQRKHQEKRRNIAR